MISNYYWDFARQLWALFQILKSSLRTMFRGTRSEILILFLSVILGFRAWIVVSNGHRALYSLNVAMLRRIERPSISVKSRAALVRAGFKCLSWQCSRRLLLIGLVSNMSRSSTSMTSFIQVSTFTSRIFFSLSNLNLTKNKGD